MKVEETSEPFLLLPLCLFIITIIIIYNSRFVTAALCSVAVSKYSTFSPIMSHNGKLINSTAPMRTLRRDPDNVTASAEKKMHFTVTILLTS